MSFLTDVLSTVEVNTLTEISSVKEEIEEKIQIIKYDVKKYMENKFLNHIPQRNNNHMILNQLEMYENEIHTLISEIASGVKQEIGESTKELKTSHNDLKQALFSLLISKALVLIDECFNEIKISLDKNKYVEAATALKQIEDIINTKDFNIAYLDIFEELNIRYKHYKSLFNIQTEEVWSKCVQMSECIAGDVKTIEITINMTENDTIQALIQSFILQNYDRHIFRLSKFILNILSSIITRAVTLNITQDQEHRDMMQIKVDLTSQQTPSYLDVFDNIQIAFDFLNFINIPVSEDECVISRVAEFIKQDFTELLVKECLHTIPNTTETLESALDEKINDLQEFLRTAGFYNDKDMAILEFAKDIDVHFANKACSKILEQAREIMKRDLHDMVDIGMDTEVVVDQTMVELPGMSPLSFPKCKISSNVMELKDLINSVLEKASQASCMLRGRLLCTASNITRMYQQIVIVHHRQNLKTIPQQTAIFHNNCMFLAHWLLTISMQLNSFKITKEESRCILYSDVVLSLRTLGAKCFTDQMKTQKTKILDTLRESDLSSLSQMTKLVTTQEAIGKCKEQIQALQKAWFEVLPMNVFAKSIGLLYNVLVEELIQRVCNAEDIHASIAEQLVNYFGLVYKNGLAIFKAHEEVLKHVKLWQKFKELIGVLKGNLQDIEYHWANGKGPIAAVFRPEELKHLIRALFKNTDRRADVLMKIK